MRAESSRAASPLPDCEILLRMGQGEVAALGELYDRHAASVLRFARRIAGTADAEDIVQATFLRALRIAAAFDTGRGSARPWLFAIAARVVQERRRSLRRLTAALLAFAHEPREKSQRQSETTSDLERGLLTLSHAKRVVLVLADVEGFTGEQIAQLLDVPVGTVWTRLHHARRELRVRLGGAD